MTPLNEFVMLQCSNAACRFRCPSNLTHNSLEACPICGSPIQVSGSPFANPEVQQSFASKNYSHLQVLLDNLRSTLNVGSIFRTADGAGVERIHLCGTTPTPDHAKMIKTGLGAEKNIPWEYHLNGLELVNALQRQGTYIAVLESTPQSTSVFCFHPSLPSEQPFLLVVGNEVTGVDPEIRAMADAVLSIPMEGAKSSLNVAVAFGIAVYTIQESIR